MDGLWLDVLMLCTEWRQGERERENGERWKKARHTGTRASNQDNKNKKQNSVSRINIPTSWADPHKNGRKW
jgi:hypothetical protein